ncbi:putative HD superfamily hydrolase of NAD metabolism [Fervidobacterium changbaicum]|uniref:Bis(5'-nucleosyl)-tetraphosphatase (Symmetrical) YqeK n=2 Tax=Fervidobacterium TaxID=2422 RepID=A0AAI8GD55_FERIS|nr:MULTISPECIES: bis(5'-nucleosyl)-tetraphosphatase (symmetrical) YqeK [Fervidobacterium]AMW32657.1 bis(5'-nucleosyl)-tetraphosphatase (symmetrical) YqeK [Fervidobacterium islandicum]QAV32691.1 HD domain-containing protein [Fervidobacterium changbaicum]SDH80223.1 putative HD superfamily hydrolase of NAD metabolism [Fervidobacterium changbaicum]
MNAEFIIEDLKILVNKLVKPERIEHVNGVVDFCSRLAKRYNLDSDKLTIMALAHDLFRDVPEKKLKKMATAYQIPVTGIIEKRPILLHGLVAAEFLKRKYKIIDEDVLLGIAYHTSGHPDFGPYAKALALADSLELTRLYEKVNQLREIAFYDLNVAYFEIIKNKIIYAVTHDLYLLPLTTETWNKLVERKE